VPPPAPNVPAAIPNYANGTYSSSGTKVFTQNISFAGPNGGTTGGVWSDTFILSNVLVGPTQTIVKEAKIASWGKSTATDATGWILTSYSDTTTTWSHTGSQTSDNWTVDSNGTSTTSEQQVGVSSVSGVDVAKTQDTRTSSSRFHE